MIYVQAKNSGIPHHFDAACALYGGLDRGSKVKLITYDELEDLPFLIFRVNVFVGSVEFMRKVFEKLKKLPRLPKNSNRESIQTTLGEAKQMKDNGETFFIKPIEHKLFTGFVWDDFYYSIMDTLPPDLPVLIYKPFNQAILSEWRVYVHNHDIVDSRNYSGDFTIAPDYGYVSDVIDENKSTFPIAYTIDVAILEDGSNVIVEFNDMWAIGNYGIPNDLYVKLLSDRYFEIAG